MVSQRMLQLGTARSVIRELFEYGRQRAAEVGAENVFDFSLGNPSVPAPGSGERDRHPAAAGTGRHDPLLHQRPRRSPAPDSGLRTP